LADAVRMSREDRRRIQKLSVGWDAMEDEQEHASEVWDDVLDILDTYAPPYCYVGSLVGDGACFGVWVDSEGVEQARRYGDVWEDPDDGSRMPTDADYRLVVSDHGNMSLYSRSGRELWGIV